MSPYRLKLGHVSLAFLENICCNGWFLHRNNFQQCNNYIPTSFTNVTYHTVLVCLSRALMATGKQSSPNTRPGRIWLVWVPSVGWWQCVFRMKRNRPTDAQIRVFWLGLGVCGSSTGQHKKTSPGAETRTFEPRPQFLSTWIELTQANKLSEVGCVVAEMTPGSQTRTFGGPQPLFATTIPPEDLQREKKERNLRREREKRAKLWRAVRRKGVQQRGGPAQTGLAEGRSCRQKKKKKKKNCSN